MRDLLRELHVVNDKRIVILVMDGLGGLPLPRDGRTELETAKTPNLDKLAAAAETGTILPIDYGITPGSAPGHFSLFGYNPLDYDIGRGVIAAMGIGFPMKAGDVAARMNFATKDETGNITDRRAGRIPTEKCAELIDKMGPFQFGDVEVELRPVKDYRACAVFRGPGLGDKVNDTDSQQTGVPPLPAEATDPGSEKTAKIANEFVAEVNKRLAGESPANACLLRGFASLPHIPSMKERYGLAPVCIAVYPDYKGVSRLLGMDIVEDLHDLSEQLDAMRSVWADHTFFFMHHKYTDSTGEDGNFDAKVEQIEKVDAIIPDLLDLKPDVVIVTGDHSTPAKMKTHSYHPVPFLLYAEDQRPDWSTAFGERECAKGMYPNAPGVKLMNLALASAGKIKKYGA
jgi:2,3-bisphosphoglycerate-independent phosphoglycerate mutase